MEYGYARVSTKEQNEQRQIIALEEFGLNLRQIFIDKQSGKNFERANYQRLTRRLKEGDTLVVKSIDRLGRNYNEILEQWRIITKEKRAAIVVLDMPLLDTRKNRDLTGTLIADIVLQLLSYVAQTEREFIRQRQEEGIAVVKAQGVHFGRPPLAQPKEFPAVHLAWLKKEISAREAARRLSVTHKTFLRAVSGRGGGHEPRPSDQAAADLAGAGGHAGRRQPHHPCGRPHRGRRQSGRLQEGVRGHAGPGPCLISRSFSAANPEDHSGSSGFSLPSRFDRFRPAGFGKIILRENNVRLPDFI